MVAPLALPLLGLLAGAGGIALAPSIQDRTVRRRGRRNAAMMQGVDLNDPTATAQAGMLGGGIRLDQFQDDLRKAFEGRETRAQSDLNSRRSAGTAAARLAWDKQAFMMQRDALQAQAGHAAAAAFTEEAIPLFETRDKYAQVNNFIDEARRWTPEILSSTEAQVARQQAEKLMYELKQRWLYDKITMGNEPPETLREEANEMFPTDLSTLANREKLKAFMDSEIDSYTEAIRMLRSKYEFAGAGDPAAFLQLYPDPYAGQHVDDADVIKD